MNARVGTLLRSRASAKTGTRAAKRTNPITRSLFYLLVLVILVYTMFPLYWALRSAITPDSQLFSTPIVYWPSHPTLENFRLVLSTPDFQHALRNSTIIAVSVVLLSLIIGSLASYALGRFQFRGRQATLYLVLSMTIFPQIAVLGSYYTLLTQFNLFNTIQGLILTYIVLVLPFTVWVLTSFFRAMPKDLEEAAYIDGASPLQTFYKVMLPLIAPGLVTTGLLAFISAWNEFLYALSFTATPDKYTVPVAIANFTGQGGGNTFEFPWGQVMAATLVVTIPLIVLTLIFQRRILAGMTAGAVKG
ncbi:MAG: carbohydrate ABC transporter permease [Chloroflexota bacterium]|nr:carbohydrate ABC transporter permease [Chloroflexota bacterium]